MTELATFSRRLTSRSFSFVKRHSLVHVLRKLSWSLSNWSTVSHRSSFLRNSFHRTSSTSLTAKSNICWIKLYIRARSANTRPFQDWSSGYGERFRHDGVLRCSVHVS